MADYYEINCKAYHEKTVSIDSSFFLSPFVKVLPIGASVIDVGCGSGRDLLWLTNLGFRAVGLEKSKGLAALAREHSGCDVIEADLEVFDFSTLSFDALLSSGSLVHIPHDNIAAVLTRMTQHLPSVIMYVSFKEGAGIKTEDGRTFYLWSNDSLRKVFQDSGFEVIASMVSESAVHPDDIWLGYVLIKNTD